MLTLCSLEFLQKSVLFLVQRKIQNKGVARRRDGRRRNTGQRSEERRGRSLI